MTFPFKMVPLSTFSVDMFVSRGKCFCLLILPGPFQRFGDDEKKLNKILAIRFVPPQRTPLETMPYDQGLF